MLVTVPFVLLLLDYWPLRRFATAAQGHAVDDTARCPARTATALQLVIEKIPLFVLAVASAGITVWAQRQAIQISEQVPFVWRLANALVTYAAYVGQFFYPARLAALYPHPGIALPIGKVVIAAVVLTAVSATVFAWRRRRPYLLVGWLWYLGMLLPVIGLVPVGFHAMADRYTYLPQIGLSLAIIWAVKDLFGAWPYRRWVGVSISVLWVTGLIIAAWVQTTYWRDSESLWTHTLTCTSRNHRAENNLGNILFEHGRLPEAIVHYQNAIHARPSYADAHNDLGAALAQQGSLAEGVAEFQKALEIRPNYTEAHNNLGYTLVQLDRMTEAIAHYRRALETQPDNADAHNNLGCALLQLGRLNEAIDHFQKAVQIRPDFAEGHCNLGNGLAQQGKLDEAIVQYRTAMKIRPDYVPARQNLGGTLYRQGKVVEGLEQWREVTRMQPGAVALLNATAWILATDPNMSARNGAEAIQWGRRAAELSHRREPAILDTLAAAYAESGRFPEAVQTAQQALSLATSQHDASLVEKISARIKLYRSGVPYRDTR
jgi:tetratricopeptide (TPR) repeat protein